METPADSRWRIFSNIFTRTRIPRIISIYLEGIKEGSRVTQLIKDINRTKPVIIWKAGLTESGSRAVASHTGSLAGNGQIWDAFFKQTGAIRVNSLEEIIDVVLAFQYLKPPRGKRTLLLGGGGGNSVAFADICGRQDLEIPPLSEKTRKELNEFVRLAGNSTRNPLDLWMVQRDSSTLSPGHGNSPGRPGHRSGHC